MTSFKEALKQYALEVGLDLVGVCSSEPFDRYISELEKRKEHYAGRFGHRIENWRRLADPGAVLTGARSVVVIGFYFFTGEDKIAGEERGKFGRIVSHGHIGVLKRARLIVKFLNKHGYKAVMGAHRKEAAVRAGLGAIGKHGLAINRKYGSWVAYQSIVTDAAMSPDKSDDGTFCDNCTACLDACPTKALYEPYRLDPRRCATCLLTGTDIAEEYWGKMPNYIMGCDICQESCPANMDLKPKDGIESVFPNSLGNKPSLEQVLDLTESGFQSRIMAHVYGKLTESRVLSAFMRSKLLCAFYHRRLKGKEKGKEKVPETFVYAAGKLLAYQRNAILAIGNSRNRRLGEKLHKLADHPVLGKYARWAIERAK